MCKGKNIFLFLKPEILFFLCKNHTLFGLFLQSFDFSYHPNNLFEKQFFHLVQLYLTQIFLLFLRFCFHHFLLFQRLNNPHLLRFLLCR